MAVMIKMFGKIIKSVLTKSSLIHLRNDSAATTTELVHLIDRFLDGTLSYDMEWDDFISWKNKNPQVEMVRMRFEELEPQLFSKTKVGMDVYCNALLLERNRLARLLNLTVRLSVDDRQIVQNAPEQ